MVEEPEWLVGWLIGCRLSVAMVVVVVVVDTRRVSSIRGHNSIDRVRM